LLRGLLLLDLALELGHDVWVAERGDVTERPALRDVSQQPTHDLAGPGLWQIVGPDDSLGPGELADPVSHVGADLLDELIRTLGIVALQGDEGADGLARVLVGLPDH